MFSFFQNCKEWLHAEEKESSMERPDPSTTKSTPIDSLDDERQYGGDVNAQKSGIENGPVCASGTTEDSDQLKHFIEVQVQETGGEHGPGHVSITTKKENGDGDVVESNHTSYTVYPGPAKLLHGGCLGSIPVSAFNRADPTEDIKDADAILVKLVSKESYDAAVAAQEQISDGINSGKLVYGVFGEAHPLASLSAAMLHCANVVHEKQRQNGGVELEDPWGIVVAPEDLCDEEEGRRQTCLTPPAVLNCVGAVNIVLNAAGHQGTSTAIVPSEFIPALQKQEFTPKDDVPKDKCDVPTAGMW